VNLGIGEWIGIVGLVLTLVGIPLAFALGRRNRQLPDLRMAFDFDQIVTPGNWLRGGLALSFKDESMTHISRTVIALWNQRGDTVYGRDVIASDPLKIEVDDDDSILQVRLVARSRETIGVAIDDAGAIDFEFLDAGDGLVVEVLHSEKSPARIVGTIPGAKLPAPVGVALGPIAREAIRTSRLRRYSLMNARGKRRVIANLLLGLVMIVMAGFSLIFVLRGLGAASLVDVRSFDLTTIGGQGDFAGEVAKVGERDATITVSFAVNFLASLAVGATILRQLWQRTKAVIAASVVADDLDPANESERPSRQIGRTKDAPLIIEPTGIAQWENKATPGVHTNT
jgi:hypothetical protein